MNAFMKAREQCADPSQSAAVVTSLLEWACQYREWNWVSGNLSRAEYSGHLTARCVARAPVPPAAAAAPAPLTPPPPPSPQPGAQAQRRAGPV